MAIGVPAVTTGDPNRATLLTLRRDVVRYIQGGDDPELLEAAKEALNDAISILNEESWRWNLLTQDIPMVAGAADYDILDTVKDPFQLSLLDTDGYEDGRLGFFEKEDFLKFWPSNNEGSPEGYTILSRHNFGTLSLTHRPTTEWVAKYPNLRFWYMAYIREMDSTGDTLNAPSEFRSFVLWHARFRMATDHGEPSAADRAERQSLRRLMKLRANDRRSRRDTNAASAFEVEC